MAKKVKPKHIRIILYCNTGFAGASHRSSIDIPIEDWPKDEAKQEELLQELGSDFRDSVIDDYGAYREDDE